MTKVNFTLKGHELCVIKTQGPCVLQAGQTLCLEYSDGEVLISGIFEVLEVRQTWRYVAPASEYDLTDFIIDYFVDLQQAADFTETFGTEPIESVDAWVNYQGL